MLTPQERKIIFLSSLGGALEFYDFVIYLLFASFISQTFFPVTDKLASLMGVYAVFALGYFVRPLGGIIFSHFGDKYGRKKTFIFSVMLMAIPTCLIGFLPTYNQIGIFATFLLIIFRLLQGLSIGGEIPGAITFACEHISSSRRGLTCGIIFAFFNIGIILGSCCNLLLTSYLSNEQLFSWGWRIPFILGGFLGAVSFYIRKKMTESPLFILFQYSNKSSAFPLIETIRYYWRELLQGISLTWLGAVVINLLFLYLPTYLTTLLSHSKQSVAVINSMSLLLYAFLLVGISVLSDKIGRRLILMIGSLGFMILSYGLFVHISQHLISVLIIFTLLSSCITIYPGVLVDLFPTSIRYTGVAISYNFSFALFGGATPLIATYLIKVTGNMTAPSFYLILSAIVCFITVATLKNTQK